MLQHIIYVFTMTLYIRLHFLIGLFLVGVLYKYDITHVLLLLLYRQTDRQTV